MLQVSLGTEGPGTPSVTHTHSTGAFPGLSPHHWELHLTASIPPPSGSGMHSPALVLLLKPPSCDGSLGPPLLITHPRKDLEGDLKKKKKKPCRREII